MVVFNPRLYETRINSFSSICVHFFTPATITAIFFFKRQLIFCPLHIFLPEILRERGKILGNGWEFIRQSIPRKTRPNPDTSVLLWWWENLGLGWQKGAPQNWFSQMKRDIFNGQTISLWKIKDIWGKKNHQQSTQQQIKFQGGWKSGILCAWRHAACCFWQRIFAGAIKIKVEF